MKNDNSKIALEQYSAEIYNMLQAFGIESGIALSLTQNHMEEIEQWFPRDSKKSTPIITAAMAARILKSKYI